MSGRMDVDGLLRRWLADGSERAPDRHVLAALERASAVPQLRPSALPKFLSPEAGHASILRMAAIAASVAVLMTVLGIVVGRRVGDDPVASPMVPDASPTSTAEVSGLKNPWIVTAPDGSFEVEVPSRVYTFGHGPDPTAVYLRHHGVEISIRAADDSGRLRPCDRPARSGETCGVIRATTLGELAEAVGLSEAMQPTRAMTTLDGEPAAVEELEFRGDYAPEFVAYVTAVHRGRPYLMRFWMISPRGLNTLDGEISLMLDAFRFKDDPAPTDTPAIDQPETIDGFRTFIAPDGSFQVRLPDGWEMRRGADPTALYVTDGVTAAISLRFGDEGGRIRQCDDTEIFGESCGMIEATSLAELGDAIALSGTSPMVHYGPRSFALRLGDEHATSISMVEGVSPPWGVRYVIAFHDGRPFILRASRPMPPDAEISLTDVLAGFSFVDSAGP